MQWYVAITREHFARIATHVEWAVMAQHAAIVAKPARSVGRLRARAAISLAVLCIVLGFVIEPIEPALGRLIVIGFLAVLASWVIVLVRRALPRTHAADRIRRDVARMLAPIERHLPITIDYELHDGRLDARSSRPRAAPNGLDAARAVVALDVVALFRRDTSLRPWRVIQDPPPALIDELRRRGTEVIEVTAPPAGYVEPLPVARQR